MTSSFAKKAAISLFASASLMTFSALPASAANQVQDGLVNVAVGDITITDAVDIGVAAQVAAQICGLKVGPVAVLGTVVDRSGTSRTVCTVNGAPITINQN